MCAFKVGIAHNFVMDAAIIMGIAAHIHIHINSMTSNDDMESSALEVRLHRLAFKIWVFRHDMDGRLKNPHAFKFVCGCRLVDSNCTRNSYTLAAIYTRTYVHKYIHKYIHIISYHIICTYI